MSLLLFTHTFFVHTSGFSRLIQSLNNNCVGLPSTSSGWFSAGNETWNQPGEKNKKANNKQPTTKTTETFAIESETVHSTKTRKPGINFPHLSQSILGPEAREAELRALGAAQLEDFGEFSLDSRTLTFLPTSGFSIKPKVKL